MKLDVKVKNLGRIKEAEFHIRPMTVITGMNGTGKSFFTKSLYSVLNVINKNIFIESIDQTIRKIQSQLDILVETITQPDENDYQVAGDITEGLAKLQHEFYDESYWGVDGILGFSAKNLTTVDKIYDLYKKFAFDSNLVIKQLIEARGLLSSAYEQLYFRE